MCEEFSVCVYFLLTFCFYPSPLKTIYMIFSLEFNMYLLERNGEKRNVKLKAKLSVLHFNNILNYAS